MGKFCKILLQGFQSADSIHAINLPTSACLQSIPCGLNKMY